MGAVNDPLEFEADRVADSVMSAAPARTTPMSLQPAATHTARSTAGPQSTGAISEAPDAVHQTLRSPGTALDKSVRSQMESRFGHDFSSVRVHTDPQAARSAQAVNAQAYTSGTNVVFAPGQYSPHTHDGQRLLAHELAHVVQQGGGTAGNRSRENWVGLAASQGSSQPRLSSAGPALQRKVPIRDVGKGEQSGMGRLDEFIARLNEVSTGLNFRVEGGLLLAEARDKGHLSEFDRQMQDFIGDEADIPMRMTNRHGLLGNKTVGYNWGVQLDAWQSGYVDIDDFLACSPTDFMTALSHLLRERQRTRNYAHRIGTETLNSGLPGPAKEFAIAHGAGLDAELAILRDYLQDPTVRFIDRETRLLRNDRGDRITEKISSKGGVDAGRWIVVLHDTKKTISLEEYRELLETERVRAQVARERLYGATEYRGPGGGVPAP